MAANPNRNRWLLWTTLGVVLVGAGIYALFGWMKEQELRTPTTKMADYGAAPIFSLTDQNGFPFNSDRLNGHIWLADLIFTNCTGSCPMLTAKMSSIQKGLVKTPEIRLV